MTSYNICKNITNTVTSDLCIGCGFCASTCVKNAIRISKTTDGFFVPIVTDSACINCGVCSTVCPGLGSSSQKISSPLMGIHNVLLGQVLHAYAGHANDLETRYRGSSGGVITALLQYLIRSKLVDAAVVITMDEKNPLDTKAVLASSEEDILNSVGSKYSPVSMHDVVKKIMALDERKYAFVGLPCHLAALQNLQALFPKLKDSIVIKIGLYCNNTPSKNATKYLLENIGVLPEEVKSISYRGNGVWPGFLTLDLTDNNTIKIPMLRYMNSGFGQYFCKKRCILCSDQTAELADISVADPWTLPLGAGSTDPNYMFGTSIVLVRTLYGGDLLENASKADFIKLRRIDPNSAIQLATRIKKANKNSKSVKLMMGIKYLPKQVYLLPLDHISIIWILRYRFNYFLAKNSKTWPLLRTSVAIRNYTQSLFRSVKRAIR